MKSQQVLEAVQFLLTHLADTHLDPAVVDKAQQHAATVGGLIADLNNARQAEKAVRKFYSMPDHVEKNDKEAIIGDAQKEKVETTLFPPALTQLPALVPLHPLGPFTPVGEPPFGEMSVTSSGTADAPQASTTTEPTN